MTKWFLTESPWRYCAGRVRVELGEESHVLGTGDSIVFASSTPHRVANDSEAPAELVWVNSPPTPPE